MEQTKEIKINLKIKKPDLCIRCIDNFAKSKDIKLCNICYDDDPDESYDEFFIKYNKHTGFRYEADMYDLDLFHEMYYIILESNKSISNKANDLNLLHRKFYLDKNFFPVPSQITYKDDNINTDEGKFCTGCGLFRYKEKYNDPKNSQCIVCTDKKQRYNIKRVQNAQDTFLNEDIDIFKCIKCFKDQSKDQYLSKTNKLVKKCLTCRTNDKKYKESIK